MTLVKLLSQEEIRYQESTYTLWGEIPHRYDSFFDLFKALDDAIEGDVINIELESPGGSCAVGFKLIHSIRQSRACVNMIVSGDNCSMGSLLAISGHSLTMFEGASLMFHTFSYGSIGKSDEVKKHVDQTDAALKSRIAKVMLPFFTQKEIDKMHLGEDFYINWDDETLPQRMKRHFKTPPKPLHILTSIPQNQLT